jgi:hypothetical protein
MTAENAGFCRFLQGPHCQPIAHTTRPIVKAPAASRRGQTCLFHGWVARATPPQVFSGHGVTLARSSTMLMAALGTQVRAVPTSDNRARRGPPNRPVRPTVVGTPAMGARVRARHPATRPANSLQHVDTQGTARRTLLFSAPMRRFKNRANIKTEATAKYAKYAKPESFRGKGLDFSRISRISRFKEFLRRGFGAKPPA